MTSPDHPGPRTLARAYFASSKSGEELRGNWVMWVLHRWPSFVLTSLCLRAGIRPDRVTLLGGALVWLLPLMAWLLPPAGAAWAVCVTGFVVIVLDCVDGDVARWTGMTSARGARLDFIVDMTFWGLLYLSIGIIAAGGTFGGWAVLGMAAGWARLLARVVNDSMGGHSTEAAPARWTPLAVGEAAVVGLSGAIPFLALAAPSAPWVVWLLLGYSALDLGDALLRLLRSDAA
ncbi:hypothetical protein GCM10011534_22060 [Pseudooceanicola nanhaiensis]|uniref:CDP-alcohol phosphatidyltransferase n=1 Tax=Pseudooceanicola nanhaiensis TaxID=375761 RepID=A0A917WFF4_9RHOB|nr:CDP-alcohol phosphatidyltransferase family protein [Pseudooceanicola nanhaiensis]GGL99792.1 hypothetical protein GCM10011534_22060 [Pseudooceanicola nanhaiensis]